MSDEIVLTLPEHDEFRNVAHLVVGGLAVRLNLTFENLEDVQVALEGLLARAAGEVTVAVRLDDGGLAARVDKRIQDWQPTSAERRLDEIGWAKDLCDALRLAKEHSRPVFLFTYSGSSIRENALAQQRC